jgi:hypothetical protein
MKKFFAFIVLVKLLLVLFITSSNAATVKGAADVYKVTMRKLELCTGSTGVTNCDGAVIIGSGSKEVDIASVNAGAVAGAYGDPALLPLGVTYTHMRVTILRKFTIKTAAAIDTTGDADACVTQAPTDALYGGSGGEHERKFTHAITVANDGTAAEMTTYLQNDSYLICANATCSSTYDATNDYTSPTYATYMESHSADTGTEHVMIYKLTSPYTVALIPPTIDISFGTQEAIGATDPNSGTRCMMIAFEPVCTITIK